MKINKFIKILGMVTVMSVLTGCGGNNQNSTPTVSIVTGNPMEFQLKIKDLGGKVVEGVKIDISNELGEKVISAASLDKYGMFKFTGDDARTYTVTLAEAPRGYFLQNPVVLNKATAYVYERLSTTISDEYLPSGYKVKYSLGDIVYNYDLTTTDGDILNLKSSLEGKKFIVVNMFFTTCGYCKAEFPYMNKYYNQYKDQADILAFDNLGESLTAIKAFKKAQKIDFPMGVDPDNSLAYALDCYDPVEGLVTAPTSLIIDRYGRVGKILTQYEDDNGWKTIFETFTSDDYTPEY